MNAKHYLLTLLVLSMHVLYGQYNAPSISITSPANGAVFQIRTAPYLLAATVTDADNNLSNVQFSINGTNIPTSIMAQGLYFSNYQATTPGYYTLTITAYDATYIYNSKTINFQVAALPNAMPVITPDFASSMEVRTQPYFLFAHITDQEGGLSNIQFMLDGSVVQAITKAPNSSDVYYYYPFVATTSNVGNHTLQISAWDNQGGYSSVSKNFTVVLPNVGPTIELVEGASTIYYPSTRNKFLVKVTDLDGVASVNWFIGGRALSPYLSSGDQYSCHVDPLSSEVGSQVVRVVATDSKGAVTTFEKPITVISYFRQGNDLEETSVAAFGPNPSTGEIQLGSSTLSKVEVLNSFGQVIFTAENPGAYLNLLAVPAGNYIVRMTYEHGGIKNEKLTILK